MTRRPTPAQDTRGRDATNLRQGVVGIGFVAGLALGAAGVGWLLALLIASVY
ncbi:MAG: hypothetical protein KY461_13405 [Actinobacteria bacterium]|nr:hypothetical protein [Actinomycetota bacterium]